MEDFLQSPRLKEKLPAGWYEVEKKPQKAESGRGNPQDGK